jgi:hypothetical protein
MSGFSYQEKCLYGSLAVDLAVYIPYVVYSMTHHADLERVVGMIALLIALQIVVQSVIAAASRSRLKDERDRLILLRGYRAGYITVGSLMLFGMAALWFHNRLGQIHPSAGMALHFLSVFYGILVISDIVKTISQLVAYRRPL